MKKVWLLGDSIRMIGYGTKVPEMLGDAYEVHQSEDNGRFAKYTLRFLFDFREDMKNTDIIHWNNGLWDTSTGLFDDGGQSFTNENEYVENMLRIARELLKITPNVIFATTTPVHPEYPYNNNEVIKRYNAALVPKLQEMGIRINDLHSVVAADIEANICQDQIHLSPAGIAACSERVVAMIKECE